MKKPVKLLLWGIVLFIFGGVILPVLLIAPIIIPLLTADSKIQFLIPGNMEIKVEETGKYYLWNDYKTVYEGETYSKPRDIPDNLKISMQKKDGTLRLDFIGDHSTSMSSGSSARDSIGYFEITEPGDYIVKVQGQEAPRVFSFGISHLNVPRLLLTVFIGGPFIFLFGIGGFVLAATGIAKMAKSK